MTMSAYAWIRSYRKRRRIHRQAASGAAVAALGEIERVGFVGAGWRDVYHLLLNMPVSAVLLTIAAFYVVSNFIFASLYLALGSGIAGARPGSFADAFFFSVETMSTIGYGAMYPTGFSSNCVMTAESVYGLLVTAFSTGALFARLSRPTARVTFSRSPVVTSFEGVPTLMFRVANRRRNEIVEAQVTLAAVLDVVTADGHQMRRFADMRVARSRTPVFALTWTILHPIEPDSPLYDKTPAELKSVGLNIVCSLSGIDDTFAQTVYARYVYKAADLRWNARLTDIFLSTPDGRRQIDYTRFHEVEDS